jgi:HEPN domain-containing protein
MACEFIGEWLYIGDMDLAVAENSAVTMHPKPIELICFHCHQAAEKYLKAYFVYKTDDIPPRTHSLETLCDLCTEHEASFATLYENCKRLTPYAIQVKYPPLLDLDEFDMARALRYATEIKAFPPLAELREKLAQEDAQ